MKAISPGLGALLRWLAGSAAVPAARVAGETPALPGWVAALVVLACLLAGAGGQQLLDPLAGGDGVALAAPDQQRGQAGHVRRGGGGAADIEPRRPFPFTQRVRTWWGICGLWDSYRT